MPSSDATTVADYLAQLPEERRAVVSGARDLVVEHLPEGYEETMQYGMVSWVVPIDVSGPTYNGQPLAYVSLANQKKHVALYLMGLYAAGGSEHDAAFRSAYEAAAGRKPNLGKSCLRFTDLAALPRDVVAAEVARLPVQAYLALQSAGG